MLKNYIVNGLQYQFEEGKQPAGAVELKTVKPSEKAAGFIKKKIIPKPANKARKVGSK